MAIVVTGATGQLGALVVRHLLARGGPAGGIVAAGRDPQRLKALGALGVGTARIDFDAPESLDEAFGTGDTVLFVSSSVPGQRIGQHTNVIRAAERAKVGRLVYTSFTHADTVDTVLTPDHRATEALLRDSAVPFTILRNNIYADMQVAAVTQAAERNEFVAGWGTGRVAGASRSDYAEGSAVVLAEGGREGQALEFAAEASWDGDDVARAASEILGKPVVYQSRTADETEIQLALAGVPEEQRNFQIALDRDYREGAFDHPSNELSALLGRPTTPLVDVLRANLPDDLPQADDTAATPAHGGAA